MVFDTYLTIGSLLLVLAVPSIVSAFSESRGPRLGSLLFALGAGLASYALVFNPVPYTFEDIPRAYVRVIGHYLR